MGESFKPSERFIVKAIGYVLLKDRDRSVARSAARRVKVCVLKGRDVSNFHTWKMEGLSLQLKGQIRSALLCLR